MQIKTHSELCDARDSGLRLVTPFVGNLTANSLLNMSQDVVETALKFGVWVDCERPVGVNAVDYIAMMSASEKSDAIIEIHREFPGLFTDCNALYLYAFRQVFWD